MKRLLELGYENSYEGYYEWYSLHIKKCDFYINIRRYRGLVGIWECQIAYEDAHLQDKVIKSDCDYKWVKKFTTMFD